MTKLITASLYNAYLYYAKTDFDMYGERAEEIEAKAKQDFLNTLNKVKTEKSPAMLKGIQFEDAIRSICDGNIRDESVKLPKDANPLDYPLLNRLTDDEYACAFEIAQKVKGGIWQVKLSKKIGNYLLFGYADVIKQAFINDIKRVNQYAEVGKYEPSIQHLIYLECSPLEHFKYLICDGKYTFEEYYHKDADNCDKLMSRIDEMVGFINQTPEFKAAFEANWNSKY